MQEILLKIRYFEIGLSKTLKKSQVYVFFRTQPLLMYKVIVNKRGLELVTSRSSGYETSSEKFRYYITWQSLWCNIRQLLSYFKNYKSKFMLANRWHHKLFHFHLSFCISKVERNGKNYKHLNISRKKRAF